MRNIEMGNQSTSGIKEEEQAAIQVPEGAQEAENEEKATEGENNLIPEDDKEDLASTPTDISDPTEHSDKKEQEGKESESDKQSEASMESNDSVSQVDCIEETDPRHDSNAENILSSDDKLQVHDQCPVGRGTVEGQAESSSSNSLENSVQDSNPAGDSISLLEECPNLSLQDTNEEDKERSDSYYIEEEKKNGDYMETKENIVDLVLEESLLQEEKPSERNVGIEKCVKNGVEETCGDGFGNNGNVEVSLKVNLNDILRSQTETIPEDGSQSLLAECPEPQEKHIIHAEEMKLTSVTSENGEEKLDPVGSRLSELTDNHLDEATASTILHEDSNKENGDENMLHVSSGSDLEKLSVDKKKLVASGKEQSRSSEETVLMSETRSVSNELAAIDKYDEEVAEKHFVEEPEKRIQDPSSTRKSKRGREASQSFRSFGGENELFPGDQTLQINPQNGLEAAAYPSSSFTGGNGTLLRSGAAEDKSKFPVSLKQNISYEVLINEISTCNVYVPNNCNSVQGLALKPQMNSETVDTTPLPSSKAYENAASWLGIDSNSDHPSQIVHLRKSPSFEFGIPLDARSEESDQTPLLVRDKSLARSFSGSGNVKFQTTMVPSDFGRRKSLDYEPIQVEEKTIRMERSTSDISRDSSFMNFIKQDSCRASRIQDTSEKQDSHVSDHEMALESPSPELALTSVKSNGKRRPKSSLFSSCLCCSAAIS